MTVGIPGTGIGGLFYIAIALLLPFRAFLSASSSVRRRIPSPAGPAVLAVLTMAGMWATGWLVGILIKPTVILLGFGTSAMVAGPGGNVLHWAMFVLGYLTLTVILVTVEIARVVVRRRRIAPGSRRSGSHNRPAEAAP